jgi:hypothetical protein
MRSRHAALALLVAIALFCCTSALAGSVEIGFVDDAELKQWMTGAWLTAEVPTGETTCAPAKFRQLSACWTVVIFNGSSRDVKPEFTTSGEPFVIPPQGGVVMIGPGPMPCRTHLEPGESCFQDVAFWPRTGEVYHGTIRVTVKSSNGSTSRTFGVKGTSDYPPDLRAAEEVRQRHEAELKAIPHVASVELDNADLEALYSPTPRNQDQRIRINVTVMHHKDIEAVRKLVPPKIEGYDTEVTDYMPRAWAL